MVPYANRACQVKLEFPRKSRLFGYGIEILCQVFHVERQGGGLRTKQSTLTHAEQSSRGSSGSSEPAPSHSIVSASSSEEPSSWVVATSSMGSGSGGGAGGW